MSLITHVYASRNSFESWNQVFFHVLIWKSNYMNMFRKYSQKDCATVGILWFYNYFQAYHCHLKFYLYCLNAYKISFGIQKKTLSHNFDMGNAIASILLSNVSKKFVKQLKNSDFCNLFSNCDFHLLLSILYFLCASRTI